MLLGDRCRRYGLFESRRVHGVARWWRLLAVGAVGTVLAGQLVWWLADGKWAPVWVTLYWLFPILALASVVVLARTCGRVGLPEDGSMSMPPS